MNPIQQILYKYPLMILDGAFSTELERRGCDLNDPLWSAKILMENPEIIGAVHEDYFRAGADCVITASYQATYEGFMKRGLTKQEAKEFIQLSVRIAAQVRDHFWENPENRINRPKPLVAASVGPYGAYMADGSEYRGDYGLTQVQLMEFHRERMNTLIEAGPDILACETIPCLVEAKAIVNVLEEHPQVYAWISFSAKDGERINSGERIEDCARWLHTHPQVVAIGVNCTPPEFMESLIVQIRKGTDKPILVYPNSGEHYDAQTKNWHGCSSGLCYGDSAKKWFEKGAKLIGGCCRTTPQDIREIAVWGRK
ncbi:homocysteine S-methyltransferase [Marinisporobacter balticus]|uniref:S-methylmethionine:homocysteine methyltransferase n=1 Tax=Marinisporobacter balticus TaxID=2018667 RepID=A0A4R2KAC5_9FIRM|nr:homocysteine S-methyltransferase [Marinisporobacter balticus]TCO70393.1 homocysteine S-methyltransferase [Marinisporobacter balticus]